MCDDEECAACFPWCFSKPAYSSLERKKSKPRKRVVDEEELGIELGESVPSSCAACGGHASASCGTCGKHAPASCGSCGGHAPAACPACHACGGKAPSACPFCHKPAPAGAMRHSGTDLVLFMSTMMHHISQAYHRKSDHRDLRDYKDQATETITIPDHQQRYTIHGTSLFKSVEHVFETKYGWSADRWQALSKATFEQVYSPKSGTEEFGDEDRTVSVYAISDDQLQFLKSQFLIGNHGYVDHIKKHKPDECVLEKLLACVTITNVNALGIRVTSTNLVVRLSDESTTMADQKAWTRKVSWLATEKIPTIQPSKDVALPEDDLEFLRRLNMTLYRMQGFGPAEQKDAAVEAVSIHTTLDGYNWKQKVKGGFRGLRAAFTKDEAVKRDAGVLQPAKYEARVKKWFPRRRR